MLTKKNVKNFFSSLSIIFMAAMLSGCKISLNPKTLIKESDPTVTGANHSGINIMDLGMAGGVYPGVLGTNFTKPSLASLQFLKSRGNNVVRIPFLWERLQPTLNGSLDATYLGYLIGVLKDANTARIKVIVDMHNYAQYSISGTNVHFGDPSGPTVAQYQDVWTKLINAIHAEPLALEAVYAYDIMNEPAGITSTNGSYPDSAATPVASFTSTDEGWADSGASYSATHGGSLHIAATSGAQSYLLLEGTHTYLTISSAAGKTIRIKGYVPANLQGDNPRIRLTTFVNYTGTQMNSDIVNVSKGTNFEVYITPTDAQWTTLNGLQIALIVNNVDGTGPYEYYIDEIAQGTASPSKTAPQIWEEYSQGAVDAIRAAGDANIILVEGYNFSSTVNWAANHPAKWITDPANKIIYSPHLYMDSNRSGAYAASFAAETTSAAGEGRASVSERVMADATVFTNWAAAQGVKGFFGELGWPNSATNADSALWDQEGEKLLTFLDSKNMGFAFWATGSWLGPTDNNLNAYDLGATTPLSQTSVFEPHLAK